MLILVIEVLKFRSFPHFKAIIFIGFSPTKAPFLNLIKVLPLDTVPSGKTQTGGIIPWLASSDLFNNPDKT